MKILEKTADKLIVRCGTPWMALWGLPFFAGGAWSLAMVLMEGEASRVHVVAYAAAMLAGVAAAIMCSEHSIVTMNRADGSLVIRHRWIPFPFRTTSYQLSQLDKTVLEVQDSLCDEGYADRIVIVDKSGERIPLTRGSSGVWQSEKIHKAIMEYLKESEQSPAGDVLKAAPEV